MAGIETGLDFLASAFRRISTADADLRLPKMTKKEREELLELFPKLNPTLSENQKSPLRRTNTAVDLSIPDLPNRKPAPPDFYRINVSGSETEVQNQKSAEFRQAAQTALNALKLREKYVYYDENIQPHPLMTHFHQPAHTPIPSALSQDDLQIFQRDGVYLLQNAEGVINIPMPNLLEFYRDLTSILAAMHNVQFKTFSYRRVSQLEQRYKLHELYNREREVTESRLNGGADFYSLNKVDNHVHLAACMSQEQLCEYIKKKMREEPNVIVAKNKDGEDMGLLQAMNELGLTEADITVDALDVQADDTTFLRFDRFNAKYNPMGKPLLRELFLKTDNSIDGRYFAEICQEVIDGLEREVHQCAEYRISIYGRSIGEWEVLAKWFARYPKLKSPNVRWMIQIPRLYTVYRSRDMILSFQDMITNIFLPIFQATLHPEQHPEIAELLAHIVGFDSVDDESVHEQVNAYSNYTSISPEQWTAQDNPPYSHWSYFLWANLFSLNLLRKARGLNTISFRPHCGEAGSHDHLATAFLTAHGINHGIVVQNNVVLMYLYYLAQLGMSVSPLSNNKLFLKYADNPFIKFFRRGLNVTVSTDDPLILHLTDQPLMEEYSVAAQIWDFDSVDLCEIVNNSIIQSGYSAYDKATWLGEGFQTGSIEGHDPVKTGIPYIRKMFRFETYKQELEYLQNIVSG